VVHEAILVKRAKRARRAGHSPFFPMLVREDHGTICRERERERERARHVENAGKRARISEFLHESACCGHVLRRVTNRRRRRRQRQYCYCDEYRFARLTRARSDAAVSRREEITPRAMYGGRERSERARSCEVVPHGRGNMSERIG